MTDPQTKKKQPQDTPSPPRRRKSPPLKLPTWDQSKAIDLAARGVAQTDIATALGGPNGVVSGRSRGFSHKAQEPQSG